MRCQSSLTFGGMTAIFHKTGVTPATRQSRAGSSLPPVEARYSHALIERTTAGCCPTSWQQPENDEKQQKMHVFCWMLQLFVLLLDQAIRQMRRESHCCFVNVRNLHPDSNKRMSRRVVTAPRLVGVHLTHYAMTGVGLLCLLGFSGISRPTGHDNASMFLTWTYSQVHVSSFVILQRVA